MVTVDVEYSYVDSMGQMQWRRFVVSGAPESPFAPAVRCKVSDVHLFDGFLLAIPTKLGPAAVAVSDRGTFAEMESFLRGEVLPLSSSAIGGQWVVDLWTVMAHGLTLYGFFQLLREGRQLEFRRHKAAAQEWAITGIESPPDDTLTRLVCAERMWPHKTVTSRFGLSRQETAKLFEHLNYRYSPEQDAWYDQST